MNRLRLVRLRPHEWEVGVVDLHPWHLWPWRTWIALCLLVARP